MSDLNKPRSLSLPLNYFKGPTRVDKLKGRLAWWALGVSVVGVLASGFVSKEAHLGASPGQVSAVHQAWDKTCSACHEPFKVTSSHSWAPPGMSHASGQTCQACHAGSPHHPGMTPELNCASCHREHKGADHSLLKMGDANCTQCHRNLPDHYQDEKLRAGPRFENVTHFSQESHPKFKAVKEDPGKLKFNHARHLTKGIPPLKEGEKVQGSFALKNIPEELRGRYAALQAEKDNDALVQLDCRACHRLDASDFNLPPWERAELGPTAFTVRGSGGYYLPITFENQCKACHPLRIGEMTEKGDLTPLEIPHRKQPHELDPWLLDHFTAEAARGMTGFWEMKATRPLPGKKIHDLLPKNLKDLVEENMRRARRDLFEVPMQKNCSLCHTIEQVKRPEGDPLEALGAKYISVIAEVPQFWFKHARFDHMAHRAVDCRECHAGSYPMNPDGTVNPTASKKSSDVLIPDIDNCVRCHSPATTKTIEGVSQAVGGVRFDCVMCHRYHNGENPMAGRGAAGRGVERPGRAEDFLKGILRK